MDFEFHTWWNFDVTLASPPGPMGEGPLSEALLFFFDKNLTLIIKMYIMSSLATTNWRESIIYQTFWVPYLVKLWQGLVLWLLHHHHQHHHRVLWEKDHSLKHSSSSLYLAEKENKMMHRNWSSKKWMIILLAMMFIWPVVCKMQNSGSIFNVKICAWSHWIVTQLKYHRDCNF